MARNRTANDNWKDYLDLNKYIRVIRLCKTPDLREFLDVSKVTAPGIAFVGLIGYVVFYLMSFLPI